LRNQLAATEAALAAAEAKHQESSKQLQQQKHAAAAANEEVQVLRGREQGMLGELEQLKQQLQQHTAQLEQQRERIQLLNEKAEAKERQLQQMEMGAEKQQQLLQKVEHGKQLVEQELAGIQEQLSKANKQVVMFKKESEQYNEVRQALADLCSRNSHHQPQEQGGGLAPGAAAAVGAGAPASLSKGEAAAVDDAPPPCSATSLAVLVQELQQVLARKQQQLEQLTGANKQHQAEVDGLKQELQVCMQHMQAAELKRQGAELQLLKLQHETALLQREQQQKDQPQVDGTSLLLQNLLALIALMEKLYGLQQVDWNKGSSSRLAGAEGASAEGAASAASVQVPENKAGVAGADTGVIAAVDATASEGFGIMGRALGQQTEALQVLGGGPGVVVRPGNARSSISSLPGTCTPSTPQKPRDPGWVAAAGGVRDCSADGGSWAQEQQGIQGQQRVMQQGLDLGGTDEQQQQEDTQLGRLHGSSFSFRALLGVFNSNAAEGRPAVRDQCNPPAVEADNLGCERVEHSAEHHEKNQQQQQAADLLRQLQQRLLQLSQDLSGVEKMLLHKQAGSQQEEQRTQQQQQQESGQDPSNRGARAQHEEDGMVTPPPLYLHQPQEQQEGRSCEPSGSEPQSSGAPSSDGRVPDSDSSGSSSRSWRVLQAALTQLEQQVQQQQEMICSMKGVKPWLQPEQDVQVLPLQCSQQQQQQQCGGGDIGSEQGGRQAMGQRGVDWQQVEQQAQQHRLLLDHLQMLLRQVST
jgi:hypothetical protein